MADGGVWAKVYPDSMVLGNGRNLLYNGAMQVHQRGTSATGITSSSYNTADRWVTDFSAMGTWTNTVESDAPTESGFRKSFKVLCTTASASPGSASIIQVQQRLEGADVQRIAKGTASAQQLTLSFWVKSNVTGTYIAYLYDADNGRIVSASYSIALSATWERKAITFPADTTGAFDNDNAGSLFVSFVLGAGSNHTSGSLQTTWGTVGTNYAAGQTNLASAINNYWQITGVQLEVGETATSFEHKRYGTELAECMRYFQQTCRVIGPAINGTRVAAGVVFPVPMRANPTTWASGDTDYLNNSGTVHPYDQGNNLIDGDFIAATAGSSKGVFYIKGTAGSSLLTTGDFYSTFITADAEL